MKLRTVLQILTNMTNFKKNRPIFLPFFGRQAMFLVLVLLLSYTSLEAQEGKVRVPQFSISGGAGIGTARYALIAPWIDQAWIKGYKGQLGYSAGLHYQKNQKWGVGVEWSLSRVAYKQDRYSHGNIEEAMRRITVVGVMAEYRFAIRAEQYLYTSFGLSWGKEVEEQLLTSGIKKREANFSVLPVLVFHPIGACIGKGRVKGYLETGLFALPLVSGGVKVGLF